jgi:hypothetical protein
VEGVAEAGFTRFGIPLGQRMNADPCTGEVVDVVERGSGLGVEVRELGDIREAFAFLAGHELPADAVPTLQIALPEAADTALRELIAEWEERYAGAVATADAASSADFGPELREFAAEGEMLRSDAADDLAGGHAVSAFNRIWFATVNAEFVARAVRAASALRLGGLPALHQVVAEERDLAGGHVDARLDEIADVEAGPWSKPAQSLGPVATLQPRLPITTRRPTNSAARWRCGPTRSGRVRRHHPAVLRGARLAQPRQTAGRRCRLRHRLGRRSRPGARPGPLVD